MSGPVPRFPVDLAGRVLLALALLCPHVWSGTLLAEEAAASVSRIAYGRGYLDGRRWGMRDRTAQHDYDMANKRAYQRLEQGFDPDRDDADAHPTAYDRGFEAGYDDGYHGGRTRSRRRRPDPPSDRPETPSSSEVVPRTRIRVPAGAEIRVRMKESLTTRTHKVGHTFSAHVIQDLEAETGTAIPKGAEIRGAISQLARAGRIRGRARMKLHFKELRFGDGRVVLLDAQLASLVEPHKRTAPDEEGTLAAPGTKARDAGKVGGAAAIGALIGLIGGGKEGVAVGAAAGAAVGAAGILVTRGRDIVIPVETRMILRLRRDLDIPVPRRPAP